MIVGTRDPDRIRGNATPGWTDAPRVQRPCRSTGNRSLLVLALALLTACQSPPPSEGNPRPPEAAEPAGPTTYRVHRGDTLYGIAHRYDLDYRSLAAYNDIDPPYTIYPGDRLKIPADGETAWTAELGSGPEEAGRGTVRDWTWPIREPIELIRTDTERLPSQGLTILAPADAPLRAAADGVVVYSGAGLGRRGELIILKHDRRILSAYAIDNMSLTQKGKKVKKGEIIGKVESSNKGKRKIYFEIRKSGSAVDPLGYLPATKVGDARPQRREE